MEGIYIGGLTDGLYGKFALETSHFGVCKGEHLAADQILLGNVKNFPLTNYPFFKEFNVI